MAISKVALIRYVENGKIYRWKEETILNASMGLLVERIPLACLQEELNQDHWFQSYDNPTVLNVIKHFKRIISAELHYPIIISPTGRILDGIHRLAKAWLSQEITIDVVRLKELPESDYDNDEAFLE